MDEFYIDATAGNNFVFLDWNDEWRYNEKYQEKKGYEYSILYGYNQDKIINKICNINAPYKHENLEINKTYYYKLIGVDRNGHIEESYILDATPGVDIGISFLSRKVIKDG